MEADCNLIYNAPSPDKAGEHDILGSDPMFVNYDHYCGLEKLTQSDLHLSDLSPCINTGIQTDTDIDCEQNQRPYGKAYDIGTYEFLGEPGNVAPVMTSKGVENGAIFPPGENLVFEVEPKDEDGIASVEFYMDGELAKTANEAPYTLEFTAEEGTHRLYAVAADNTGLSSKSTDTTFIVTDASYVMCENSWKNDALPSTSKKISVSFSVVPVDNEVNNVVGLSDGEISAYTMMSCVFRISPEGIFDAYNDNGYAHLDTIQYETGKFYDVRMNVNVEKKTYDVYVTPRGGQTVCIARDFVFRSKKNKLNNWGVFSESGSSYVFSFGETESGTEISSAISVSVSTNSAAASVGGLLLEQQSAPELSDGIMMLPVPTMEELFGAAAEQRGDNIYLLLNGHIFETDLGTQSIYIDGVLTPAAASAYQREAAVYLPLRQIFEAAGYAVAWNGDTGEVVINE